MLQKRKQKFYQLLKGHAYNNHIAACNYIYGLRHKVFFLILFHIKLMPLIISLLLLLIRH